MCQTIKSVKENPHLFFSLKLRRGWLGSKFSEFISPSSVQNRIAITTADFNPPLAAKKHIFLGCLEGLFGLAFFGLGLLLTVSWYLCFDGIPHYREKLLIKFSLKTMLKNITRNSPFPQRIRMKWFPRTNPTVAVKWQTCILGQKQTSSYRNKRKWN